MGGEPRLLLLRLPGRVVCATHTQPFAREVRRFQRTLRAAQRRHNRSAPTSDTCSHRTICALFFLSAVPYTLDDVLAALNEVLAYDWKQFVQTRIYDINPHAPMGGVEAGGWRLVYRDTPSGMLKAMERKHKFTQMSFSLGLALKEDATIQDVIPDSVADKAGLSPGMKLAAVNGRKFTTDILRDAVKAAKTDPAPIELLVENHDYFKTCKLDYHDGERYPDLQRVDGRPDLLGEVIKPLVPPAAAATREAGNPQPAGASGIVSA